MDKGNHVTISPIASLMASIPDASFNASSDPPGSTGSHCHYGTLTGKFGIAVQFLLALLAFSCLIVKRYCEPAAQRRPWIVWFYDTSKQGVGASIIHLMNIFISGGAADPCIWYVMNFLLDSTVGLLFIYIILRVLSCLSKYGSCKELKNGEYGDPPECQRWFIQCIIYSLVVLAEKGVVMGVMKIPIWIPISEFIVSPIRNAKLELVLVMFVIPIVVNALIFWVVDNFLMRHIRSHARSKRNRYSKLKTDIEMEEQESLTYASDSSHRRDS